MRLPQIESAGGESATERDARMNDSLFGHFHKCPELFYTDICSRNCRIFGLEAPYVPEMRINDFSDTGVAFTDPETFHQQDLEIMQSGIAVHAQATLLSADGRWLRMKMLKRRAEDGGIDGETVILPLDAIYHGWMVQLDREREVLPLHNGAELRRNEMRLLRAYLRGVPYKIIARQAGVSVKAIEKRLHRVRDKLDHPNCHCYSLHGCINWHGLTRMLMDEVDWFNPQPTYRTYPC
ncbi:MAG: hypothetical protein HKN19_02530 [Halioglobus sp.]|nr:hypothetical protein [Halioglobus sp.]